jgi:Caspase domain
MIVTFYFQFRLISGKICFRSVATIFSDGIITRIQDLWRLATTLFMKNYDETDGEKSKKKFWRRCFNFFRNLLTRHSKIAPTITSERNIFPRLAYPQTVLDFYYDMNHGHRGIAVVFNHEHFENNKRRYGTDKDRDQLVISLERFGFDVKVYNDLSGDEMEEEMHRSMSDFYDILNEFS